jgi:hypothetical protein
MVEEKTGFAALIISRRAEEFEALRKQRERLLAERRAQRKIKREIDRRQEFVKRSRSQVEAKVRHRLLIDTSGLLGSLQRLRLCLRLGNRCWLMQD